MKTSLVAWLMTSLVVTSLLMTGSKAQNWQMMWQDEFDFLDNGPGGKWQYEITATGGGVSFVGLENRNNNNFTASAMTVEENLPWGNLLKLRYSITNALYWYFFTDFFFTDVTHNKLQKFLEILSIHYYNIWNNANKN